MVYLGKANSRRKGGLMNDLRIILNEEDFAALVRGKSVVKREFAIVLSDIGWDRMYFQLERARRDAGDSADF